MRDRLRQRVPWPGAGGALSNPSGMQRARALLREHAAGTAVELGVNVVLPFVIYSYAKAPLGDVGALLASTAAPLAWSALEFARRRRIDRLSLLVLAGIALSLLAFVGGGSVRFLQLRENFVTGIIALVFLGSAAIGKPLIYQLAVAGAQRKSASEASALVALRDNVYFRRTMLVMTLVWGGGLLVQTALACALVFAMSIQAYLVVSPILGYGTMGALALWTVWYGNAQKRIGAAPRAAAVPATTAPEAQPNGS